MGRSEVLRQWCRCEPVEAPGPTWKFREDRGRLTTRLPCGARAGSGHGHRVFVISRCRPAHPVGRCGRSGNVDRPRHPAAASAAPRADAARDVAGPQHRRGMGRAERTAVSAAFGPREAHRDEPSNDTAGDDETGPGGPGRASSKRNLSRDDRAEVRPLGSTQAPAGTLCAEGQSPPGCVKGCLVVSRRTLVRS